MVASLLLKILPVPSSFHPVLLCTRTSTSFRSSFPNCFQSTFKTRLQPKPSPSPRGWLSLPPISAVLLPPLDLTEENVRQVLVDARTEFAQIFDASVGITGQAELAEIDGPLVKLRLQGRFWHKRSTVLARLSNYLKNRIPEILEVDIEDERQLDDSPENF